jgi:hypothetical protein
LGLYVFGRRTLLENTYELAPVVSQLVQRPTQMRLVLGEVYASRDTGAGDAVQVSEQGKGLRAHAGWFSFPTTRTLAADAASPFDVADVVHMGQFVKTLQDEQGKRVQAAMEAANQGAEPGVGSSVPGASAWD